MSQDPVASLQEQVQELWPNYKANVYPMWKSRLRNHSPDHIAQVLLNHRSEYPDAARPNWKLIYDQLTKMHHESWSELDKLIAAVRHINRNVKGSKDWTDADCFQVYVDARVHPWLHEPLTGKPRSADDSRRTMADQIRSTACDQFVEDFRHREESMPQWFADMAGIRQVRTLA